MNTHFKYLVYDMETVVNKVLLNKVLYGGEGLSDEEAYQKHLLELEKETPGRNFVNPAFQKPVSLAAIAVADNFQINRIGLLGGEQKTAGSIVREFWGIFNKNHPILIDFNGKGFDLRVLELWAFQLGISIHERYFKKFGVRHRFSDEWHLDLQEFITNFGAVRYRGGLNLLSKLLGKPGKMETQGDMVQTLHDQGEFLKIDDYCLSDTLDTYFVFLRTRVLTGELKLEEEQKLVEEARLKIEQKSQEEGFLKNYLQNFGQWIPNE